MALTDFSGAFAPPNKLKPKSLFEWTAPSFDDSSDLENTHTTGESPTNAAYIPPGSSPTSVPTGKSAYSPPSSGVLGPSLGQQTRPDIVSDIYAPRLRDVTERLDQAYQAPEPHGVRGVVGALLGARAPVLGDLISGDYSRKRSIKPLQQEYGLLSSAIKGNQDQALQQAQIGNYQSEAELRRHQAAKEDAQVYALQHPEAKPGTAEEQSINSILKRGAINPDTKQPYTYDEAYAHVRQTIQDTKPDPAIKDKEQVISDYLAANKLLNTPANREKARGVIAGRNRIPRDPELADINKQLKQAQLDALQGKADAVSPATQKILQSTVPTIEQVDRLLDTLDPVKNDNTPFSSLGGRLKYAAGIGATEGDKKAGDIQRQLGEMEMDRVIAGARVLQGSSRAYQALQLAMKHAPDPWTDSKALMHQKLTTIRQNLQDVADDAVKYGKKSGQIPAIPGPRQASSAVTGGRPSGATHTGIGSVDQKKHWLDANGKDLGPAE